MNGLLRLLVLLILPVSLQAQTETETEPRPVYPVNVGLSYPLSTTWTSVNHLSYVSFNFGMGLDGAVHGIGVGLLISAALEEFRGFQYSNLFSLVAHDFIGLQLAGVYANATRGMIGWQSAFFGAHSNKVYGVQVAGLIVVARKQLFGWQSTFGVAEARGESWGVQLAGVVANAGSEAPFHGLQLSGFWANSAGFYGVSAATGLVVVRGDALGVQAASLNLNWGEFRGVALGFVNIGEEMHGLALGLVNVYENGLNQISAGFDSTLGWTVGIRSGHRHVPTSWILGFVPAWLSGADDVWSFSAAVGLGFHVDVSPAFWFGAEGRLASIVEFIGLREEAPNQPASGFLSLRALAGLIHPPSQLGVRLGVGVDWLVVRYGAVASEFRPAVSLDITYW